MMGWKINSADYKIKNFEEWHRAAGDTLADLYEQLQPFRDACDVAPVLELASFIRGLAKIPTKSRAREALALATKMEAVEIVLSILDKPIEHAMHQGFYDAQAEHAALTGKTKEDRRKATPEEEEEDFKILQFVIPIYDEPWDQIVKKYERARKKLGTRKLNEGGIRSLIDRCVEKNMIDKLPPKKKGRRPKNKEI